MSVFEKMGKAVSDTAKAAAKKSVDIVEVTKLYMSIGTEEEKIKKVYFDLGKAMYESFLNGREIDENFKEYCESIKGYEDAIKEIKLKILELKDLKLCPQCQAEIEEEFDFCPKCGAKQA